jgi:hypothetical protein
MATWYIYPLTTEANRVLARHLPKENFHDEMMCEDKKKRPLWQSTDYDFILRLLRDKLIKISIHIFKQNPNSKPFLWEKKVIRPDKQKISISPAPKPSKQTFGKVKAEKGPFDD